MPVYDPNGNYSRHRMQLNPIQALKEGGEGRTRNQRIEGGLRQPVDAVYYIIDIHLVKSYI